MKNGFDSACELMDGRCFAAVARISRHERERIREIRLRRGRSLSVVFEVDEFFVTPEGVLVNEPSGALQITSQSIEHTYRTALRNSVHAFEREIAEGYVTVKGGVRVGFCGKAVCSDTQSRKTVSLSDISSINIRISREIIGCAETLYNVCFSGGLRSLLLVGPPSSGKTTLLRDLSRIISRKYRVALIDERSEIAAVSEGIPSNNVGYRTDVFTSYDKYSAVMTAVRVMGPQVMICDEIGAESEINALKYAAFSGVCLIASCHASDLEDARKRPAVSELLDIGAFKCAAVMGTGIHCGKMTGFYEAVDKKCSDLQAVLC